MNGCARAVWPRWVGLMALLLLALAPAFLLEFPMPPGEAVPLLWVLSFSASKYGIPVILLVLLLLAGFPARRLPAMLLPLLVLLGVGAWLNEDLLKPWVGEPRPNVRWLASEASGPVLGEGAAAFYAAGNKGMRSDRLEQALDASGLVLPSLVRGHWIAETGYSFPSGHALASAMLGGGFIFWLLCLGRRLWLVPLILGWMAAVDWSRLFLGVHRAQDVLAGVAQGVALAALSLALSSWWLRRQG